MSNRSHQAHEVHLLRRPGEKLASADLGIARVELPPIAPGQFLVRNKILGLDPVRRVFFADGTAPLNAALHSFAIGEVVESLHPAFTVGMIVAHNGGMRDLAISNGRDVRVIDPQGDPLAWHADALGIGGFFGYIGLIEIARARPGETVFVSSAAGSVGSVVTQIARQIGCRVIGSAGSADKCRWLTDVAGVDVALNYREGNMAGQLARAAPEGIDVYFDNVGGEQLDAALQTINRLGRVVIAGMVSAYDTENPLSERFGGWTKKMLTSQIEIRSFSAFDHERLWPAFQRSVSQWLRTGAIKSEITLLSGLDAAPAAFVDLLGGKRMGKTLIELP